VFWLHIKRLERPMLLPPAGLVWATLACLAGVALVRPLVMAPQANAFLIPADIPSDLFFAFWIPIVRRFDGGIALAAMAAVAIGLLALPVLTARRGAATAAPSTVDQEICTGCRQCSRDCPYGAIQMIKRTDHRPTLVASVDPALCVGCGICAGSCAPMGVGPPGRTGRDQIAQVQAFLSRPDRRPGQIVAICCDHGAAAYRSAISREGAALYTVDCAGNLHTSVIERLLRGGAGGVLVLACQPRDCWSREGPRWLIERVFHDREAELQARVDRRRVQVVNVAAGERRLAVSAVRAFADSVRMLSGAAVEPSVELHAVCEPVTTGSDG
jgi:ferredoxin